MPNIEIIAEVATGHGGSVDLAKDFIRTFAEAGADTLKFQLTRVRHLQPTDPQYEWFKQAELSTEQFAELKAYTESLGKQFLLTCYNAEDVDELIHLGCDRVKIGSGEAGNYELAERLVGVKTIKTVLVSCGIWRPLFIWPSSLFFACTTRYPAPRGLVACLYTSDYHGWSDHSIGTEECQVAILKGAKIIECHVQLPHQARPPQPWEKTIEDIRQLRQFADFDAEKRYWDRWQFR